MPITTGKMKPMHSFAACMLLTTVVFTSFATAASATEAAPVVQLNPNALVLPPPPTSPQAATDFVAAASAQERATYLPSNQSEGAVCP